MSKSAVGNNLRPPHMDKHTGVSLHTFHTSQVISSLWQLKLEDDSKEKPGCVKFSSTHSRLCGFSCPDTPLVYGGQRWLHLPGYNILARKSKERSVWDLTKAQIRLLGKGEFCFLLNRARNLVPFNRRGRGANSPTRVEVLGHSMWYDRVGMEKPSE